MSSYTPGPWQVSPAPTPAITGTHSLTIIRQEGGVIANAVHSRGTHRSEAEANARLIAAAPDLLEALKRLRGHADGVGNGYCRLCGGHRLHDLQGRPQQCENPECLSHVVEAALNKGDPSRIER